ASAPSFAFFSAAVTSSVDNRMRRMGNGSSRGEALFVGAAGSPACTIHRRPAVHSAARTAPTPLRAKLGNRMRFTMGRFGAAPPWLSTGDARGLLSPRGTHDEDDGAHGSGCAGASIVDVSRWIGGTGALAREGRTLLPARANEELVLREN